MFDEELTRHCRLFVRTKIRFTNLEQPYHVDCNYLQTHLDELSRRLRHSAADLRDIFFLDVIAVHGENPEDSRTLIRESPGQFKQGTSTNFGCLCDKPIDKMPQVARDDNLTFRTEAVSLFNTCFTRHVQHDNVSKNAESVRTENRKKQLRALRKMHLAVFISERTVRVNSKLQKRSAHDS